MGLRALLRPRSRRTECREPRPEASCQQDGEGTLNPPTQPEIPLESMVREAMKTQVATLQEFAGALAVLHELEGAVERLKKVQKSEDAEDLLTNFQRAVSAQPESEKAAKSAQWLGTGSQEIWSFAPYAVPIKGDGQLPWAASDADTPATSTVVSAAASEVASDNSDSPPMSRRPSLRDSSDERVAGVVPVSTPCVQDGKDMKPRKASRSSMHWTRQDIEKGAGSDTSSIGKKSDASSMNWRADALDVGENLAAEAAAKKDGHMSVDSIVALVQEERERWEEERQALELRVEELKEKLRSMQAVHSPDAEKRALKIEQQELRKVIKARSRFGAWVCEKHLAESDDEDMPIAFLRQPQIRESEMIFVQRLLLQSRSASVRSWDPDSKVL
eukprot:s6469_g1.t1